MLFIGQWRKHTKSCGIPYLTLVDLSDNGVSHIQKKHRMLLIRMFSKNLTMFGVSKVLLLFIAIYWLLKKLDPGWVISWVPSFDLFHSRWLSFSSYNWIRFQFVPRRGEKRKEISKKKRNLWTSITNGHVVVLTSGLWCRICTGVSNWMGLFGSLFHIIEAKSLRSNRWRHGYLTSHYYKESTNPYILVVHGSQCPFI